jgi:hypothetical protein
MTATWACLTPGCNATGEGTWTDVDEAAARHAEKAPKHATVTRLRGKK